MEEEVVHDWEGTPAGAQEADTAFTYDRSCRTTAAPNLEHDVLSGNMPLGCTTIFDDIPSDYGGRQPPP
jgi:hypothetical protein